MLDRGKSTNKLVVLGVGGHKLNVVDWGAPHVTGAGVSGVVGVDWAGDSSTHNGF